MRRITLLGTGLIGMFYTMSLHGRRGRDRVGVAYSRTAERAKAFAAHLRDRFSNPKVNAQTETEYFAKLSENNKIFLYVALAVAVVMSLGGIFGVMNTMFAAVAP